MIGYLYPTDKWRWSLKPQPMALQALPLAAVEVPPGERGLAQAGKALQRLGIRRALALPGFERWEWLGEWGIAPVDPLPLCRAMAPELALFLLRDLPLRRRSLALRGSDARLGWALAHALCPRTGALQLDFDRGEEELGDALQACYGAAPLHLGQGPPPQVSVELSPRPFPVGTPLKLWGKPDLAGLTLTRGLPPPLEVEELPFLTLLWETGRVKGEEIQVTALDRPGENPYNIHHC